MEERFLQVEGSIVHATLCLEPRSVDNRPRVFRARNLGRGSDSESDAGVAEEGCCGTRVAAQVEVDVCAVLVRVCEPILRAQRVSLRGAQVVDCSSGHMLVRCLVERAG
jgi:hypothetical protein